MTWDDARVMQRSPFVTIGAHSLSHPILKSLSEADAFNEIHGSKLVTEKQLGCEVRHFAYPFGSPIQVGAREYKLAERAGFVSAVSTRMANIMPQHRNHMHALPRIYFHEQNINQLDMRISGATSAKRWRGRRVVTV